jgi:hypothetical protein
MEYFKIGNTEFAVGMPNEEERERLKQEGYIFMSKGEMADEPHEPFEVWMK